MRRYSREVQTSWECFEGPQPWPDVGGRKGLGQGADVVLGLAEKCELRPGHCLVFDNFFTGLPLMSALSEKGLGGTGTARDNRIGKPEGLMSVEKMKKMPRGTTSATFYEDVAVVRWQDNRPVTVVSNINGVTPTGKCSRWSRQERRKVTLDLPAAIQAYNHTMGGVDLHDQFSASYRIRVRSKKWWWPLFSCLVRSCAVNAWLMYRKLGNDISQLQFVRQCTQELLVRYGTERRAPGPAVLLVTGAAGDGIRRDGLGHWPRAGPTAKARCKVCGCRTKFICGQGRRIRGGRGGSCPPWQNRGGAKVSFCPPP
ncbi:PiggyBac transposable element-derived protein 3 [Amphibalanus amphitrite]|uniref:PiggyBac transposable element-derived protein 3 n=1 Tax=Amphibalanus amphitrite TaxID=1232801 RepID=A0A6A4VJ95_AMPAM|nr:PiggyBac transposable element-derived protein 3 [Amphibalanus amphitrite]